jgi:toxin ParE1/3/4
MAEYRLTHAAQADIVAILAWSDEQFGEQARKRYEALIVAAIRDAAWSSDDLGRTFRPELGDGVFTWHLAQSRDHARSKPVRSPRHFLICRMNSDTLIVGRVLHDAMELQRHLDSQRPWDS